MSSCCSRHEYDAVFTSKYARRTAKKLKASGLDETAGRMANFLSGEGIDGLTVLEIGGGVGGLHMELLRRGASRATNVELSTAYDAEAARLLADAGLADRVTRRIVNLATDPDAVPAADVVVLHRVVCCYPDFEGLLGAAADHARRMLVFSYPRPRVLTRAQTLLENASYAIRRQDFRTFVHAPRAMLGVLADRGLSEVHSGRSALWQYSGTVRSEPWHQTTGGAS